MGVNIGERIRKLRTEKLMTQSELAGTEITRNMLSRIENGVVSPSLSTLLYLAERLNVPAGYLLADNREEAAYRKTAELADIKNAYISGNFKICRDMCLHYTSVRDDEINLILSECNLGLGIENFENGELRIACAYFDEALYHSGRTIYATRGIRAVCGTYFRYIRSISAMLSSDVIDETEIEYDSALFHEFSRYVIAMEMMENGKRDRVDELIAPFHHQNPLWLHVSAKYDIESREWRAAYDKLHQILTNAYRVPEPLMYHVFCDMEVACRELEDYKGAYEYSQAKLSLLEKLLSENAE